MIVRAVPLECNNLGMFSTHSELGNFCKAQSKPLSFIPLLAVCNVNVRMRNTEHGKGRKADGPPNLVNPIGADVIITGDHCFRTRSQKNRQG